MERGELVLIDTNVLLSATDAARSDHETAREVFEKSPAAGVHLAVSGQVLREYLVVATRPISENGFGMAPEIAVRNAELFKSRTVFLEEAEATADHLRRIVRDHSLAGVRIHDANLRAVMATHRVDYLVTRNAADFEPFVDITVLTPPAFRAALPG